MPLGKEAEEAKKSVQTDAQPEQLDHAHRGHALLSASSSKQWLNCPPSARLQENFPNVSSSYAQEGTFMHEVCEYKLRHNYFHEDVPKPQSDEWYSQIWSLTALIGSNMTALFSAESGKL